MLAAMTDVGAMHRRFHLAAAVALFIAGCSGSATPPTTATESPVAAPTSTTPEATSTTPASTATSASTSCLNPDTTAFRSQYSEKTDGFTSLVLREVEGDKAQWVLTYPDSGSGDDPVRAQVIVGDEAWNLQDGAWEPLLLVPIRRPLMPWVNGYVNGVGVTTHLAAAGADTVAGIETTIYKGGVVEMTAAFPGKMRGREFIDEETSFRFWVDDCGALLRAEVVVELGGEERDTAIGAELPTTYRYEYEVYDVGAELSIEPPAPSYVPAIPSP